MILENLIFSHKQLYKINYLYKNNRFNYSMRMMIYLIISINNKNKLIKTNNLITNKHHLCIFLNKNNKNKI